MCPALFQKMTLDKRDRLYQQHEDAKQLKVDIDRRREQVEAFLGESLSGAELQDYQYYIRMKSKYTIQLQELEDKITLGTEQISALQKSMPGKKWNLRGGKHYVVLCTSVWAISQQNKCWFVKDFCLD